VKPRKVELEIHVETDEAEAAIEELTALVRSLRTEVEALLARLPVPPTYTPPSYTPPVYGWNCPSCGQWIATGAIHTCWRWNPGWYC
jgi:hypothetical protein